MTQTKRATESPGEREAAAAAPVLAAVDGSPGGRDALALARVLSTAEGARCVVETAHAVGTWATARALAKAAAREGVGTIVVGSPHRGEVGRALLGSVAVQLLHHAPCAVVVAPRGYAEGSHPGLRKIAVAYDGTEVGKVALRRAEEIAARSDAALEIIVAEDIIVSGGPGGLGIRERRSAAEVTAEALASLGPAIEAESKVIDPGWPQVVEEVAEGIAVACDDDVDLLLLGSKRGPERLLYGSVSKRLVAAARCPVLVVPRDP
jgi:nucleotide-binding universal stress UspA family protein